MRLSTMTKLTFAIAAGLSLAGATAWAQNLKVMGTTTGVGDAVFQQNVRVAGTVFGDGGGSFGKFLVSNGALTMSNPDSTGISAISLDRWNENGRYHAWRFWNMNAQYGQDSLQLWEYQNDGNGQSCLGDAADGAICAPRLTVTKGGRLGVGTQTPQFTLDVNGPIGAGNSDIYFTQPGHYHSGIGNTVGYAAIENAADQNALMIMGRTGGDMVRRVGIWDYLQVNGTMLTTSHLQANGRIIAGNSDLYFTNPNHNHTGVGNAAGSAAIENAADYGTLMILGRAGTPFGRRVDVWDYLAVQGSATVSGSLSGAPDNPGLYLCPSVTVFMGSMGSRTVCGGLSLTATCTYTDNTNSQRSAACTLYGRLIKP